MVGFACKRVLPNALKGSLEQVLKGRTPDARGDVEIHVQVSGFQYEYALRCSRLIKWLSNKATASDIGIFFLSFRVN